MQRKKTENLLNIFFKLLLLDIFTADVIVCTWCVEQQANKEHRGSVIGRRMGEILKQEKKPPKLNWPERNNSR